ncbi:MAG: hypothetical protein LBJ00_13115 [Planctomycetaceae bacterium]|nr:hypothetical protein [Planctomycetaceae bacterium]
MKRLFRGEAYRFTGYGILAKNCQKQIISNPVDCLSIEIDRIRIKSIFKNSLYVQVILNFMKRLFKDKAHRSHRKIRLCEVLFTVLPQVLLDRLPCGSREFLQQESQPQHHQEPQLPPTSPSNPNHSTKPIPPTPITPPPSCSTQIQAPK